ncbi:MAG: hypothetical protein ACI9U2_001478 [Bradymonadia bacterium]|jgi:hypothetical protein
MRALLLRTVALAASPGLLACTDPAADDAGITVLWSAQSTGECAVPARGLPGQIDEVIIQNRVDAGWTTLSSVGLDVADPDGTLVPAVPTGDLVVRLVACSRGRAFAVARPLPFTLGEDDKLTAVAHFRPVNALSCAGTGLGPEYDQFSATPIAFGAALSLGRTASPSQTGSLAQGAALIGGADRIGETQVSASNAHAWSVFDWHEGLFWPGVERARRLAPRTLTPARLGVGGGAFSLDDVPGQLLVGGSPSLTLRIDPQTGPLQPSAPDASAAAAVFFDPSNGGQTPIVLDPPATPRSLGGVGAGNGWVVHAGGLEHGDDGTLTPSASVEIFRDRGALVLRLGAPLIGATVTHLEGDAFLVWGADVAGCGARPGYLIRADAQTVAPLTLPDPPGCDVADRAWYGTAYHTATRLRSDGQPGRVLIIGGLPVRGMQLQSNPDPGTNAAANAIVLTVDIEAATAIAHPVLMNDDLADAAARRALHAAAPIQDDRVLISGGWGSFGKPTSFVAADTTLIYDDGLPAGRMAIGPRLAEARFGHVSVGLPDGRALIAGGVSPDAVTFLDGFAQTVGALVIRDSAEIFTPPLVDDPCVDAAPSVDSGVESDAQPGVDDGG